MNLGDTIHLRIEKKQSFSDKVDVVDDDFVVIGISKGLAHYFGKDMWSNGFNSFEYGKHIDGRPDIVRMGSIYVPVPQHLDEKTMEGLHYDKKVVDWGVLNNRIKESDHE